MNPPNYLTKKFNRMVKSDFILIFIVYHFITIQIKKHTEVEY